MARAVIQGLSISAGVGMGPAAVFPSLVFDLTHDPASTDPAAEKAALEAAGAAIAGDLPEDGVAMLADPLFHGSVVDRIESGWTAANAVVQTTNDLLAIFGELPDPTLRGRAETAEEVGRRLFRRLHGLPTPVLTPGAPVVLVTDEMSAFDATRLHPSAVAGIVVERGGAASHFAIIAKQLGIPAVSGVHDVLHAIADGEECVCDGVNGTVSTSPDAAERAAVNDRLEVVVREREALDALRGAPTATRDGRPVRLWGNIAGPADVQPVLDAGGTGVGMFRTEFIYMGDEAPSEERQAMIYGDILRRVPGPVVMRTLEAGGDKSIPYLTTEPEENPNLGWQGLRMCLDMEDLFLSQLRAMIAASGEGELWIMFPFVSALWELRRCRELIDRAHADVVARGIQPGAYKVGVMVETPAAAVMADEFLEGFDFCSIGTNDLTQFTLAADRMNPKVARWYDCFHPGVLRLIAMTARAANRARKPIGMAGNMASNPLSIPFLIGLGFDSFSATAPQIRAVKRTVLSIDSREARELAAEVLTMRDTDQVKAYLQERCDAAARAAG